jgi:shikimate 5-dehydrogenase
MPHKFTAFAHCATSSERAKMLGVVSVIRRNPDATWHGDMLDGLAFVKAQKDHGAQPEGARVLLVGDVIAGHGVTPFLEAAESAGCKTANGGDMVEAAQDVMADFMLQKADSSTGEG